MWKRTCSGRVSAGANKKRCLDTAGESSSTDTESELLFPDTESATASTDAVSGNSTLGTDTVDLDIADSLTRARVDRENQGSWEAEYSYGGEADLHLHCDSCTKNPGHKDFIPVDKFSIEDLPEGYRHKEQMDYTRALSDLIVRVAVTYVSERRPATVPDSGKRYPGYDNKGQKRMTVGTGCVSEVKICRDRRKPCECKDCRNSSTSKTKYAVITIATAKHVVFDDSEAEHTTCHLFFDRGNTPEACSGVVTLTGMKVSFSEIESDRCHMEYITHDVKLGIRLLAAIKKEYKLRNNRLEILPVVTKYERSLNVADEQPLMIIVSHPHGCSKHISIGRWTSVYYDTTEYVTSEYTAATCPGSSGAPVGVEQECPIAITGWELGFATGVHRGKSEELPGVNYFKQLYDNRLEWSMQPGRYFPIV